MGRLVTQAAGVLRLHGGRMTGQRRLILETLDRMGGHPTAEQIYDAVRRRDETINPSTIYRTLGWLAEAGLVNPRRLEPGLRREQFDPALPGEHHHFVCTRCGRVIEFAAEQIEQIKKGFARQQGVAIERASLTLYGVCAECLEREAETPQPTSAGTAAAQTVRE
jgi:Fur family transcriptional regulator, ferric uptake regulator